MRRDGRRRSSGSTSAALWWSYRYYSKLQWQPATRRTPTTTFTRGFFLPGGSSVARSTTPTRNTAFSGTISCCCLGSWPSTSVYESLRGTCTYPGSILTLGSVSASCSACTGSTALRSSSTSPWRTASPGLFGRGPRWRRRCYGCIAFRRSFSTTGTDWCSSGRRGAPSLSWIRSGD